MRFSSQVPARPLDLHLVAEFARAHDLAFVAMFGSRARGTHSLSSDYDLALMPDAWDSTRDELRIAWDLESTLRRGDLDSVWLPLADWVLAAQVARDGRALYEKEPGAFAQWRRSALLEAADGGIWRRRQWEGLRRSLYELGVVDLELVRKNANELETALSHLRTALDLSREAYVADVLRQWAVNFSVILVVEYASTINAEVAASAGFPATGYHDAFENAAHAGWVDHAVANRLAPLTSLRNRLVHAYGKVRVESVYDDVRASLSHWQAYLEGIFKKLAPPESAGEQPGNLAET